jgi:hypothetical protein
LFPSADIFTIRRRCKPCEAGLAIRWKGRFMLCPFLEEADTRCASHFNLTRLSDAFSHCAGRYHACPVYQRLLRSRAAGTQLTSATGHATPHGRIAG